VPRAVEASLRRACPKRRTPGLRLLSRGRLGASMGKDVIRLPDTGDSGGRVAVRPAASRDELQRAFHLVYGSYFQRGYIAADPSEVRLSLFNAFPSTVTFVSLLDGDLIATVTLVPDTPVGLPMDDIYHEEVQALRQQGRHLAEVTMLADRRRRLRRSLPMLLQMMKSIFDYATLVLKADDLCITINPRHETYYERLLLFEPLGGMKTYPSVRNNPALAKRLDLNTARSRCEGIPDLIEHFFTNRTPRDRLTSGYRMACEDLQCFFAELTELFKTAPPKTLRCLRDAYPDCPWDQWTSGS